MDIIYISLIIAAFGIELSTKCNTDNLLKKMALLLIILGSLLHLSGKENIYVETGVLSYFGIDLYKAYFSRKRRKDDSRAEA